MKQAISWLLSLFLIWIISACQFGEKQVYKRMFGATMGTQYSIVYNATNFELSQLEVDSILKEINASVSTYETTSIITTINVGQYEDVALDTHFIQNFEASKAFYKISNGSFDPTVMPLVNYWGFGYAGHQAITSIDSSKIDSILNFVGFDLISMPLDTNGKRIIDKNHVSVQLDFSGLAKGYAADIISNYATNKGIEDVLIEIGGDGLALGQAAGKRSWKFGINEPIEGAAINEFHQIIQISDMAIATSGNYRNFHKLDGKKYGHTINPKTGYPEKN